MQANLFLFTPGSLEAGRERAPGTFSQPTTEHIEEHSCPCPRQGHLDFITLSLQASYFLASPLFLAIPRLIEGIGLEARQASKELENKDAKIYVAKSTTVHNHLFCAHTLCRNYVANTFLLVSSSVRSKQLLHVFCARSRPKKRTKTYNKESCRVSCSFPSINYGHTFYTSTA